MHFAPDGWPIILVANINCGAKLEILSVLIKAYNDKIPIFHLIGC